MDYVINNFFIHGSFIAVKSSYITVVRIYAA